MKKLPGLLIVLVLINTLAKGQSDDGIQKATFGVQIFLNDFNSAAKIRANSLGIVIKNREFGKIDLMSAGLAVNFMKGIARQYDFTTSLAASYVDYPMQNKPVFGQNFLLLEGDVSVRGKLLSPDVFFNPYLQIGMGASKYKSYYGAFVPVGAGFQMKLSTAAFILINAQYRVPITETTNYHFWYSMGISANLGKKSSE